MLHLIAAEKIILVKFTGYLLVQIESGQFQRNFRKLSIKLLH